MARRAGAWRDSTNRSIRWDHDFRHFRRQALTRQGEDQRMAVTAEVKNRVGWITLDRPPGTGGTQRLPRLIGAAGPWS